MPRAQCAQALRDISKSASIQAHLVIGDCVPHMGFVINDDQRNQRSVRPWEFPRLSFRNILSTLSASRTNPRKCDLLESRIPLMRVRYLQVIALLASTGAVFDATASDQTEVIKALQSLDENQHQGKRSLRAYDMSDLEKNDDTTDEERGIDLKQLDDLIKPDKIQGALDDATKQKALFKEWFKDKDMSAAIYKALSTNGQFLKNKDILIAYGNYMTRLKNDKVLGGWLHTKTLESVLASLQAGNLDKMRRTFGKWYDKKKTAEEVSRLVKAEPDLEKKFRVLLKAYEGFVEKQTRLAKKAADAT